MSKTEDKIIAAGFGGQGVLLLGELIAYSAIKEGKHVTWVPSYGPESRGGTCNCQVIYKNEKIGSPVTDTPNVLIAMTRPSIEKFLPKIVKNGLIIYDSSLIKEKPVREDLRIVGIPATEMSKTPNMVILGAYIELTKNLDLETLINKTLPSKFTGSKSKFIPKNVEAINLGIEYIKKNYPQYYTFHAYAF